MHLLLDHQAFVMQRYGGISKYFAALSSGILLDEEIDHKLKLLYTENGYLSKKSNVLSDIPGHWLLKKTSRMERWNRRYFSLLLKQNNYDVFHPTYYHPYFLDHVQKPYVITVHDMIHELFPEFFHPHDPTAQFKRKVIERASHIIAISESTKHDLQRLLNVPDHKVSVVYHGWFSPKSNEKVREERLTSGDKRYVLYVGERSAYKNFYRFMTAMAYVMHENPDLHLVCAGGGYFGKAETEYLRRLNILDRIRQVTVNENELGSLYRNAVFFCYPSIYEGFGLPILESFANDCPVSVSNTSCFKEVGGDAVSYFDPYQIDSMIGTFESLLNRMDLRQLFIDKGKIRLEAFTEESCVKNTLNVYKMLKN